MAAKKKSTARKSTTKKSIKKTSKKPIKKISAAKMKHPKKASKTLWSGRLVDQFEGIKDTISSTDWMTFAHKKRVMLIKEISSLGEEMLEKIRCADILANRDQLVSETKKHIESIVSTIHKSRLLDRAMAKAKTTGKEILSFFNIPSSRELKDLQKRLVSLEKKLSSLK